MESKLNKDSFGLSQLAVIISAVVIVLIAAVFWYFRSAILKNSPAKQPLAPPTSNQQPAQSSLGGTIYQGANNPLQNKLPGTTAPVPNPLQNVYKNPFQ